VVLRPPAAAVSLAGSVGFAVALGFSLHRERGTDWLLATLAASLFAGLATAAGVVAGRLLRDREQARAALRRLQAENLRIRADERQALAAELEGILFHDFAAMRTTVAEVSRSCDPAELRRTIALIGDRSRSTLASVRVALRTLRAEREPVAAPATRAPAWIDALHSPRGRRLVRAICLGAVCLALGHAVRSGATRGVGGALVVETVLAVASPLTVVVALWRVRVGLAMAVVVLLAGLVAARPSLWVAIPTALLYLAAVRGGRWYWIAAVVAGQLGCMAVQLARHGDEATTLVAVLEGVGICSVLLGLTVSHFETVRDSTRAELEQLHTQQGRIATEERVGVARELHDVVGHQLSLVSLQALAAEREHDPGVLRGLLHRIHQALETGESEISGLVGALHSTGGAGCTPPALTPTVVAREISRQLHGHDYHASFTIDPRVDGLDPTTQSTVARILQESGTNVLRHAPPGARCTFAATIDDGTLTFLARSPLPEAAPEPFLSGGYGLRGIRERVDLTGGTFFAGSQDGSWEVRVRIRPQTAAGS
jgi:signal transduction histidine kinase